MKILFLRPIKYGAHQENDNNMKYGENVLSVYEDDDYYNYYDVNKEDEAFDSNYRSMMGFVDEYYLYWNANENELDDQDIIDTFYDDSDGQEWSVWNRFIDTKNNEDDNGLAESIISEWTKGDEGNIFDFNNVLQTTTESNNEIKRRCMILFGKPLCLCEFINGLTEKDGLKPLYQCDNKPFLGKMKKQHHEQKKVENDQ